jgi:dolichyl-phosphate-mannose-protein mannosyltransferase
MTRRNLPRLMKNASTASASPLRPALGPLKPRPSADLSALPRPIEPRPVIACGLLMLVALAPRLALFPSNQNLYGDAVIRTELAERWLANPHWISSFADGAFQFGPLHLYLLGLALKLWPAPELAGRVVSLVFGIATVVPLYLLTRRLFDWKAAVVACLALSAWGMHIQFSTTAASESLALFLVLCSLWLFAAGVEEGRFAPTAYSALMLNLACATRYDAWLLIPLLSGVLLFGDSDRIAAITRAVFFGLLCLPFPLIWMQGNEVALGSPFAPIQHIEEFHRAWVGESLALWGPFHYRLQNLLFWPGIALVTLSPLVALFGLAGMWRAWKQRPLHRWLIWTALIPTAYFTFRSAVLLNFQPLGRFTANQLALLLPYVCYGFRALVGRGPSHWPRIVAVLGIASAIGTPVFLGVLTSRDDDGIAKSLAPVSPISKNPAAVTEVARFIQDRARATGAGIILDTDPHHSDMQIAFFSGLPEEKMARYRWDTFQKRLLTAQPAYLIRIDGGQLIENLDFQLIGNRARLGDRWFEELPGFKPFHVYRPLEPK